MSGSHGSESGAIFGSVFDDTHHLERGQRVVLELRVAAGGAAGDDTYFFHGCFSFQMGRSTPGNMNCHILL